MSSPRIIDLTHNLQWQQVIAAVLILGFGALIIDYARILYLRSKMPPGPFPLPIVGNVLQFPKEKPWYRFEEWSKKYNEPVITVWIGRNPTVWLNDAWCASELLDKRAGIYSSRPHMVVFGDLGSGNDNLVTMKYGDRWSIPYHPSPSN